MEWTHRVAVVAMAAILPAGAAVRAQDPAGAEAAQAGELWRQMRAADVDSAEFKAAKWKLTALLGTMPADRRTAAATAMMDRYAEACVNEAALEQFGPDPLPITDIQRILWDTDRSFAQRELLKTYFSFCRPEAKSSVLTEPARRQLVDLLAERIDDLAATGASYGEQRLMLHLASAALSGYARRADDVPPAGGLLKALEKYAASARPGDGLAAAIPTWLSIAAEGDDEIDDFSDAARSLGHWDPLVRLKAAAWLGERVEEDPTAARAVIGMLQDARDEVRAAAARVFAFARDYRPDVIVPQMVAMLTRDRGVVVQAAAADVLIGRAEQAAGRIDALLARFDNPTVLPGRKRTSHILRVLAKLLPETSDPRKARLLELAKENLRRSPDGALAVMEALGPDAAEALSAIREYRDGADRFRRVYIDRHVLPAITSSDGSS